MATFFEKDRADFFRPLTGPWRAVTLDLIVRVYESFFGVGTSSSHFIEREELRGLAQTSIQLVPGDHFVFETCGRGLEEGYVAAGKAMCVTGRHQDSDGYDQMSLTPEPTVRVEINVSCQGRRRGTRSQRQWVASKRRRRGEEVAS